MRNKNNPGLYEQDDLSPQDLLNIQHPMLTMPDGRKVVSCTNCRQRPLTKARLCVECYDERMRIADWKAKLDIVRRGTGKPKLTCPWCGAVDRCDLGDWCCGNMQRALFEIAEQEYARHRSDDVYSPLGIKPL